MGIFNAIRKVGSVPKTIFDQMWEWDEKVVPERSPSSRAEYEYKVTPEGETYQETVDLPGQERQTWERTRSNRPSRLAKTLGAMGRAAVVAGSTPSQYGGGPADIFGGMRAASMDRQQQQDQAYQRQRQAGIDQQNAELHASQMEENRATAAQRQAQANRPPEPKTYNLGPGSVLVGPNGEILHENPAMSRPSRETAEEAVARRQRELRDIGEKEGSERWIHYSLTGKFPAAARTPASRAPQLKQDSEGNWVAVWTPDTPGQAPTTAKTGVKGRVPMQRERQPPQATPKNYADVVASKRDAINKAEDEAAKELTEYGKGKFGDIPEHVRVEVRRRLDAKKALIEQSYQEQIQSLKGSAGGGRDTLGVRK